MKRREFFEKAGIGSAALASLPGLKPPAGQQSADRKEDEWHGHGEHKDMDGPESSATVSFGQWNAGPLATGVELDRFPNNSPRNDNNHQLIPKTVEIKAGGCVNFLISGFHYILIYDNRTKPEDIDVSKINFPTVQLGPTPGPPLINDPVNRIYRGLDPSIFPQLPGLPNAVPPTQPIQDRVEIVRFPNPGRFLVICGVLPHFYDPATGEFIMYGYVRVKK